MRAHRFLILLATTGAALLAPAAAVAAPSVYPPGPPAVTVSASTVVVGNTVILNGTNFGANDNVSIDVTYTGGSVGMPAAHNGQLVTASLMVPKAVVGHVTADANGAFQTRVQLDRVGTAVITATGSPSGVSASVTVRVLASGATLPRTGTDGGVLAREIGTGIGAVLLGVAAIWLTVIWRRRNRRVVATSSAS